MRMKEQGKTPQDKINKRGIGKLPDKQFRTMIVKMKQNVENVRNI